MKKYWSILLVLTTLFLITGCTAVRIDTDSIDNTINVVLSKNNKLYNRVGKGYKYYVPRGVKKMHEYDYNQIFLYYETKLYWYVDIIICSYNT